MILVISGTREGTELIALLAEKGNKLIAIPATSHGTKLAVAAGVPVFEPFTSNEEFSKFCLGHSLSAIIDATHPFPNSLSKMGVDFSKRQGVLYIRFLREETILPESPLIKPVFSWEEAAAKASGFGQTIFLTTGSNNLDAFLNNERIKGKRVVVRVLPDYKIVQKCQGYGLTPKDIVAMQGPFSKEMNRQQFKMYNASVVVTKDSGQAGGTDTKISAALSLGLPVVVIKRKVQPQGYQIEVTDITELFSILKRQGIIKD